MSILESVLNIFSLNRINVCSIIFLIGLPNKLLILLWNICCFFGYSKMTNKNANTNRTSCYNNRNKYKPLEILFLYRLVLFHLYYFFDHNCVRFYSSILCQIWCTYSSVCLMLNQCTLIYLILQASTNCLPTSCGI